MLHRLNLLTFAGKWTWPLILLVARITEGYRQQAGDASRALRADSTTSGNLALNYWLAPMEPPGPSRRVEGPSRSNLAGPSDCCIRVGVYPKGHNNMRWEYWDMDPHSNSQKVADPSLLPGRVTEPVLTFADNWREVSAVTDTEATAGVDLGIHLPWAGCTGGPVRFPPGRQAPVGVSHPRGGDVR